mmetsp:Transcript_32069/g.70213  ORF Transcript_32069/g.70213 Transcript_32069/m.70213 type:complete len:268 (+) Transcript_32069:1270-2073(+)
MPTDDSARTAAVACPACSGRDLVGQRKVKCLQEVEPWAHASIELKNVGRAHPASLKSVRRNEGPPSGDRVAHDRRPVTVDRLVLVTTVIEAEVVPKLVRAHRGTWTSNVTVALISQLRRSGVLAANVCDSSHAGAGIGQRVAIVTPSEFLRQNVLDVPVVGEVQVRMRYRQRSSRRRSFGTVLTPLSGHRLLELDRHDLARVVVVRPVRKTVRRGAENVSRRSLHALERILSPHASNQTRLVACGLNVLVGHTDRQQSAHVGSRGGR